MSAQDLLGKSHEELVLMLIHLRRQSAHLNEAIDAARAEMDEVAAVAQQQHHEEGRKMLADLQVSLEEFFSSMVM